MQNGIRFENHNNELAITRNGETIISAETLYSLVFDLLAVNCNLPEEWPRIRQKFDPVKMTYEITIGADSDRQIMKEIIDDESYIHELREGEYFLESVIDPPKFVQILKNKLVFLGLNETTDFVVSYNKRFGRISVLFMGCV